MLSLLMRLLESKTAAIPRLRAKRRADRSLTVVVVTARLHYALRRHRSIILKRRKIFYRSAVGVYHNLRADRL
jgi:hypothetical protein